MSEDREQFEAEGQAEETSENPQEGAPTPEQVEQWKQQAEDAQRLREEHERAQQELAQMRDLTTAIYSQGRPQAPQQDLEAEEDLDLSDPSQIKSLLKREREKAKQEILQEVNQTTGSLNQQEALRWAHYNRQRMIEQLTRDGDAEMVKEVERQAKEWNLSPQHLAQPDAYDSIITYLYGKRALEARRKKKASNLSSTGRSPTPEEPFFDPAELNWVADQFDNQVTDKDLSFFSKPSSAGGWTIDDFEKAQEASK